MKKIFLCIGLISMLNLNSFSQYFIPTKSEPIIQDNTMTYNLEDCTFIGKNSNGEDVELGIVGVKVSCTCNNKSGNCMPFIASGFGGSTSGCAGGCSNCTKSAAIMPSGGGKDIEVIKGGIILTNAESKILNPNEEAIVPAAFEELLNSEKFIKEYSSFISKYIGDKTEITALINSEGVIETPEGYSFYCVSIFGRAVLAILPNSDELVGMAYGGKASCSCSAGSCTVKTKSVIVGSATYCEGDCKGTCTLAAISNLKLKIQTYE
jgi:hypothetical protein